MKNRALKKALSIVCVLALLMSLCVVSFAGNVSGATGETYTFHINGVTTTKVLEAGADLGLPEPVANQANFLGWYDKTLETKYTTADAACTDLYAKYDGVVLTFEDKGYYDPNGTIGTLGTTAAVVTDPLDANNTVIVFDNTGITDKFQNVGLAGAEGADGALRQLVDGQKYTLSFKYYFPTQQRNVWLRVKVSADSVTGMKGSGGVDASTDANFPKSTLVYTNAQTNWAYYSETFVFRADSTRPNFNFTVYNKVGEEGGLCYFDDITIMPYVGTETYTLINGSETTTVDLETGTELPVVANKNFVGWFDETLTAESKFAGAQKTLVAKYNGVETGFEADSLYDPKNALASSNVSVVKDPLDAQNNVLCVDGSAADGNFALLGAIGAQDGLKLVDGQHYRAIFRYYSPDATNNISFKFYGSTADGLYTTGGKTAAMVTDITTFESSKTEWTEVAVEFDYVAEADKPYLVFAVEGSGAKVYLDDISILQYTPVVAEDFEMDFENDPIYSETDANKFEYAAGNGYITRGEIFAEDSNHFLRVAHFRQKKGYHYFTVNNGTKQLELIDGGLYTIEFDYRVKHSETISAIGVGFVKPSTAQTSGLLPSTLVELAKFEYRDDGAVWEHVEYTFQADLSKSAAHTSLAIYFYNATNVPEEMASVVDFDNVKVTAHAVSGRDGIIVFDTLSNINCDPIVKTKGTKIGKLPDIKKPYYTLKGWKYYDANGEAQELTEDFKMPVGIVNAEAVWELDDKAIELDFRTNLESYDSLGYVVAANPGEPIVGMPKDPYIEGQKFLGWYVDRRLTTPLDLNKAPAEDTTIYAKWENIDFVVTYDDLPDSYWNQSNVSLRYEPARLNGNFALNYDIDYGTNFDTNAVASAALMNADGYIRPIEGVKYKLTFKYKVYKSQDNKPNTIYAVIAGKNDQWDNHSKQDNPITVDGVCDWTVGTIEFVAKYAEGAPIGKDYLYIGTNGNNDLYIDDVVVETEEHAMNIYGTIVRFNTNGGQALERLQGDPGDKLVLPTPKRSGYKFLGWFTDFELTQPVTDTVFGEVNTTFYAKWQLAKFTESYEEFPPSTKAMGIAGAYTLYNKEAANFDPSNVKSGETSLFRKGVTAGDKAATVIRSADYALNVGDTYTISLYVKPTSIGDANGAISLIQMDSHTAIGSAEVVGAITKMSDLKEGEWQLVSYTFKAATPYVGISTGAGNDLYIDDVTITLYGYTGGSTGDASVSPIIILSMVIVAAGALLVTSKKVFAK